MELRLIDGNELYGIESLLNTEIVQNSPEASFLMSQVLHDIQAMPTIDPENLPIVQAAKAMCREMVKENRELSKQLDISRRRSGDLSRELEQTKIELESMRNATNSLKMHLDSAEARCDTLDKLVKEYQEQLIPGYRERAEKAERERDAAVEDLSKRPHRTTCKHGEHCDYISVITGMPDCHACDEWEWSGPQKED